MSLDGRKRSSSSLSKLLIKKWSKPKAQIPSKLIQGVLLLAAAFIAVFVCLQAPQLLPVGLVHSTRLHDLSPSSIELRGRLQPRELKAESESVGMRESMPTELLIQDMIEPEEDPTSESLSNNEISQQSNATDTPPDSADQSTLLLPDRRHHKKYRSKLNGLRKAANLAWKEGKKAWKELEDLSGDVEFPPRPDRKRDIVCPKSIFLDQKQIEQHKHMMQLPCGLALGSSITVIGSPRHPHMEYQPRIGHIGAKTTEVSQFMFELHGTDKSSRILHINPRLKGDWSDKPVIELNSFHHGQWGRSQRCDGAHSQFFDTVEGLLKCEKWSQGDNDGNEPAWWLRRLIGRTEKPELSWPYPFGQNRSFIMTVRAGLEGYHMSVDGRHITSFPYAMGLLEENVASAYVGGDVDLRAIIATSLPSAPPRTLDEQIFENWELWKAPKLSKGPIDLFIGVLSSSSHFAERMAVRQTWFQSAPIQSGKVVARFFVAMHADKDINLKMKKEAEYYGDMVMLPFMDHYDLVVLKTVAICEYGIRNVSTPYIMKADDDTFIRVDAVMDELKSVSQAENLYLGNMNMFHRPLRTGKWAVTFEEWPDEEYPTYANGPGYIISQKIARFIVAQNRRRTLELFKMEDVSMGLWVKQFHHASDSVQYVHSWKFYQAGCEDGYIAAHYQSPAQFLCMWKKLLRGVAECCKTNR